MNEKEVTELRRRLKPDKTSIRQLCGCYVNEKREIISMFGQSLGLMGQEETEAYLALFRRSLSGALGKNLIDLSFTTHQVADSEEHRLLMALRDTGLQEQTIVQHFFEQVVSSLHLEGQYLILLAADQYDVPWHGKDGQELEDASSDVFRYILCCICPVKQTKAALSYSYQENGFRSKAPDLVVAAPELGFLFPAFDDRAANLYNALYYTKNICENHQELVDSIFHIDLPMPAQTQKETFESVLSETLGEQCQYNVVQQLHQQLCEKIEAHKETRDPEPLVLSKGEVEELLEETGVSAKHLEQFGLQYDQQFGPDAALNARNLVDAKKFQLRTPDVVIQVKPGFSDLVTTRVIDGVQYILVCASEGVEVNGVPIHIAQLEKPEDPLE